MISMRMQTGITVCLLIFATAALSTDQAWFKFRGFSEDGTCAAWETGGVHDGSGFPWIRFEVIDTESSIPLAEMEMVWEDFEDEIRENASQDSIEQEITDTCNAFGILPENTGGILVNHPVTDLGVSPDTVIFCFESYSPSYNSGEITAVLRTLSAEQKLDYPEWFPTPVALAIDVIVNGEKQCVFSEEQPPDRYAMCFDYRIAAIYSNPAWNGSLLFVLHSEQPGFEGSDGRFRVVSGLPVAGSICN